tara:strand:- start:8004 stop:8996 length:993 start_codon:yes stop_codon:yes gene_type:complete
VNDANDLRDIKDAINAVAGTTGISAEVHTDGNSALVLTHSTGEDIKITAYDHGTNGSTLDLTTLDQDGNVQASTTTESNTQILSDLVEDTDLLTATAAAVNNGSAYTLDTTTVNGYITITSAGNDAANSVEIIGVNGNGDTITESLGLANAGKATSTNTFATVTSITQRVGNSAGNNTTGVIQSIAADAIGQIRFNSSSSFNVNSSVNTQDDNFLATTAANTSSLSALSTVALGTAAGAATAIDILDGAIAKVNDQRAKLGAISNRLDATVSNLTNIITNTESSVSNIRDADFSKETSRLTRAQILNQAATSMLAQANASKQSVLSLLQG